MTEAQHIGIRIRELRKAKGMTLQQLGDVFGISRASVSEWESGRSKPDASRLVELASTLGVSVEYLLDDNGPEALRAKVADIHRAMRAGQLPQVAMESALEAMRTGGDVSRSGVTLGKRLPKKVDEAESNVTEWPIGKLPLISWVQAGEWSEIVDNFQPGDAEDWIACPFPSGRHGFVLRVVGDSMYNPGGDMSFRDGDFISVNPERDALHRSLVIARRNREKATFKQLLIDESDGPMLHALNPNWPTRYIPLDKTTEIIGVVTGQWRPLV
ncbi:helix-turn-helix family protein [Burkholderia pseudomallei MSHR3951]|uniref:helix-turn-helix domain-containing protein n=1 Tax=Burkholderia pseudomallei TaxID=28450 RepID=UPI000536C05B|nr:S24 family peptidase [Burkholderia pseudomallei]KGV86486.1 helix-turn-helix family protein [Burkholderia pseudomallei MSHR3951]